MFQCFARNLAGEIQTNTYLAVTSMSPLKFFFTVIHTSADSFCLSFSSVLPLFSFLILSCPSLCLPFLHPSIYISLCSDRFVSLGCSGNYCLFLNERMSRRSRETEAPCQILRAVPENETWQLPLLSSPLSSQLLPALLGRKLFMSLIITSVLPDFAWTYAFFSVSVRVSHVPDPSPSRYCS